LIAGTESRIGEKKSAAQAGAKPGAGATHARKR
jgi:hypothetical protein